ncbi:hypothetical protein CI1B_45710 [Bradyrhizobium ivorense]|uniref:DUF6894 domain-containing protein n=1 Tax=Bradyrhizobium ivorense TaxID=2511166 RepID=A0A508TBS5_9BRAD|nr:hypothetical protein [Bradyrhizobium ivorense]VIO72922.1 hypothetical protein CI1B_45710 [Bradyrhizobium ivorense]
MRTYYFDGNDGIAIRDRGEVEFANDGDAIAHSMRMASRIRCKNPTGNDDCYVVVINESGEVIHREAVYPAVT